MIRQKIKRSYRISKYIIYRETLVDYREHIWTFLGAFVGIGSIAWLQTFLVSNSDCIFLIGSFGASSVLIYGAIQSPLAQPRNLIGGHVICSIAGVTIQQLLGNELFWIAAPLAVSSSIVLMQISKTLHPPGGATALIAVAGSEKVKALGYYYVLSPVLSGVLILFLVALFFNNITPHRSYPTNSRMTRLFQKRFRRH